MYISTHSQARSTPAVWLASTIRPDVEPKSRSSARRARPVSRARPVQHARQSVPRLQPVALDQLRARVVKAAELEQKARAAQTATLANARHAAASMLVAGLVLLVFNSDALTSYVRDLPPNQFTDGLVVLADGWHGLLAQIGIADAFTPLRDSVEWLRDLQF